MAGSTIKDFRAQVETRKFCFCLPVRLGVFVVALLTMVAGSILGALGWMQVMQLRDSKVELTDEISAYVYASIFSLLGLISLFGFVGSLVRYRGLVVAYSVGLAVHTGLSIACGIFHIYTLFKPSAQSLIDECIKNAKAAEDLVEDAKRVCETGSAIAKGIIVGVYVLTWILQIYAYFIVERYAEQLEDEEMAKLAAIMPQQHPNNPMSYVGYPHRYSYGYNERDRRSYYSSYYPKQGSYQSHGPQDDQRYYEQQPQGRPHSQEEYAFALPPQQPLSARKPKDASDLA